MLCWYLRSSGLEEGGREEETDEGKQESEQPREDDDEKKEQQGGRLRLRLRRGSSRVSLFLPPSQPGVRLSFGLNKK